MLEKFKQEIRKLIKHKSYLNQIKFESLQNSFINLLNWGKVLLKTLILPNYKL